LRHYASNQKVAGSIPDEIVGFSQFTLSFQQNSGPGVYSVSNRNEYQQSSLGEARPARKTDTLTAIGDPIVYKMWEPRHLTVYWNDSFALLQKLAV
jgi:hypothetical protein